MGENICEQYDRHGISLQTSQRTHVIHYQKIINPIKKMGRRLKETFLQRRPTDGQEAHEKMLNISNHIREMKIKTTMRYPLTPITMTTIKKSTNNKCWRWCGEKETLLHCSWECKLAQSLWRTVWRFLKTLTIELPCCSGAQLCPTLCDPMDCSPPGSSVHRILQAKVLEWVANSFSRGSS